MTILLPVAALKPELGNLLAALDQQDYTPFEVIVVHESMRPTDIDAAKEWLHIRFVQNDHWFRTGCSNKVSNMLYGLQNVSSATHHIIFIDDDVMVEPDFLRRFRYLLDLNPGTVVTSFRYFAHADSLLDHILLAANNCLGILMLLPRWKCIWGGCFGLSRQLAEHIDLSQVWSRSIADDLDLTACVRQLLIPITVSPFPLSTAEAFTGGYKDLLAWVERQFKLCRFYARRYYIDILTLTAVITAAILASLLGLSPTSPLWQLLVLIQALTVLGTYSWFRHSGVRLKPDKFAVAFVAIAPVLFVMGFLSLLGGSIVWKGKEYNLMEHSRRTSPSKSTAR